ncbi:hypothetical protein EJ07DRAFT_181579 [Lizonia empirigonia]|nr:hypothetical protein EJ07DRAFT_181579 [Lizonia empirigonia]
MSQQPWPNWTPSAQPSDKRSSQYYQQFNPQHTSFASTNASYVQPFYGTLGPPPIIAELPAPLPSAPPTSTPERQLTEDEQLARKLSAPGQQLTDDEELARQLQHLEVQEARSRSNSNVSIRRRPVISIIETTFSKHAHEYTVQSWIGATAVYAVLATALPKSIF